ncbi:MAG: hypothetical protein AB7J35_11375 [Dehalococcoidia bacterium]
MNHTISINPRRLILLGIFGLLAVLTYGFAAANGVPASNAGDGQAAISGYAVTNVHYVLNSSNPSTIDSVTFSISPGLTGAATSRISLNGGSTWLAAGTCTGSTTITCNASGTSVTALSNLRVVAAQ